MRKNLGNLWNLRNKSYNIWILQHNSANLSLWEQGDEEEKKEEEEEEEIDMAGGMDMFGGEGGGDDY